MLKGEVVKVKDNHPYHANKVGMYEFTYHKHIPHHNDPPCDEKLVHGKCLKCNFVPDMQSVALKLQETVVIKVGRNPDRFICVDVNDIYTLEVMCYE